MRKKLELPWFMFVTDPEPGGGADPVDPPATPAETDPDETTPADPAEEDAPLGEAGERALNAMKQKERETRAKLRAAQAELAALKAPKEGEETPEQIRERVEQDVAKRYNERLVRAEVKASAAASFADPDDAVAFLNMGDFDVDADGNVDPHDIEDALKDLLAKKPHLAKQDTTQRGDRRRVPEVPADPANAKSDPPSLDDRIAAAQAAGDYKTVIALQNERLEAAS